MKKTTNKLIVLLFALFTVVSCGDTDNPIYNVFDGIEHGAVLRGLEVTSPSYNITDLSSKFEVIVEEQDEKSGGLLSSVNVYAAYTDKNLMDSIDYSKTDALVKSIAASAFTTSTNGLPSTTISVTLSEVIAAHGLTDGQYNPADLVTIRLELVLTDGRTFTNTDAGSSLSGSYFSSPYIYTAAILCTPLPGDYRIEMHDSFGDGWQTDAGNGGSGIQVTLDDGTVLEVGMCSPYGGDNVGSFLDPANGGCTGPASTSFYDATGFITIPVGTEDMAWFFPGDQYGEISFEIYGPEGTLLWSVALGEGSSGSLPVVLCAP